MRNQPSVWRIIDQIHTDDKTSHPPLGILGNPDYAKGYDLVIHDECGSDISDSAMIKGVLKPHWEGLPGVIKEEHYNNVHVFESAHPIAHGKQIIRQGITGKRTNDFVVVWTNAYGPKKTRIFSTTIGHNNGTVADSRYLDLVARGVLWATGHLNEDGAPARGYEPGGK